MLGVTGPTGPVSFWVKRWGLTIDPRYQVATNHTPECTRLLRLRHCWIFQVFHADSNRIWALFIALPCWLSLIYHFTLLTELSRAEKALSIDLFQLGSHGLSGYRFNPIKPAAPRNRYRKSSEIWTLADSTKSYYIFHITSLDFRLFRYNLCVWPYHACCT